MAGHMAGLMASLEGGPDRTGLDFFGGETGPDRTGFKFEQSFFRPDRTGYLDRFCFSDRTDRTGSIHP